MKTYNNTDNDVDALIMFAHDYNRAGNEVKLAEVLGACLKTHGSDKVLISLKERNQTGVIKGLVRIIENFQELYTDLNKLKKRK